MEKNIFKYIFDVSKLCILLFSTALMIGCDSDDSEYVGYIEGQFTYIATSSSGRLDQLSVIRGQRVKQGDLLFKLDPEPEASSVKAAQASISNLQSQVDFYQLQLRRQQNMFQKNATSKMDLERAQASYDSYVQQLAASQAQLIQTQWSLNQKTVTAPVSGEVFDTFYLLGEKIPPYRPILALLDPANIQVIFYIPEAKLSHVKIGQKIKFACDGCADDNEATVYYISPEAKFTPPIIYNKETRHTLVFMARAHLPAQIAKQFHPGQPIDIKLL